MTFIINIFKDCPPDLHKKHHTLKQKILAGFKYALTDLLYLANLRLRIRALRSQNLLHFEKEILTTWPSLRKISETPQRPFAAVL